MYFSLNSTSAFIIKAVLNLFLGHRLSCRFALIHMPQGIKIPFFMSIMYQ